MVVAIVLHYGYDDPDTAEKPDFHGVDETVYEEEGEYDVVAP